MLHNDLLIVEEKEQTVVSRLVFHPEDHPLDKKSTIDKFPEGDKSRVELPSQVLSLGLRRSVRMNSDRVKKG